MATADSFEGSLWVENPSIDDFARAARDAFDRGDNSLALEQVAAALSFDPLRPDLLLLLERTLARDPSPEAAYRMHIARRRFFGFFAAEAWALARAGRLGPAVERLVQVACFRPELPYLRWVERWMAQPAGVRGVSVADVLPHLAKLRAVVAARPLHDVRATTEAALRLTNRLRQERPNAAADLVVVEAGLLIDLGYAEQAASVLEPYETEGSFGVLVELARAHRRSEQWSAAIVCYERLLQTTPDVRPTLIDLGDARLETGDWAGAREAYERALRVPVREETDEALKADAEASAVYCRALEEGPEGPREALARLAHRSERAGRLLEDLDAYRTWLPPLRDDLADAITSFIERAGAARATPAALTLDLDDAPSPAAYWAVRSAGRARGLQWRLAVTTPADAQACAAEAMDPSLWPWHQREVDLDRWLDDATVIDVEAARDALDRAVPSDEMDPIAALFALRVEIFCAVARTAGEDERCWQLLEEESKGQDGWRAAAAIVALGAVVRQGGERASAGLLLVEQASERQRDARLRPALALASTLMQRDTSRRRTAFKERRSLERSLRGRRTGG